MLFSKQTVSYVFFIFSTYLKCLSLIERANESPNKYHIKKLSRKENIFSSVELELKGFWDFFFKFNFVLMIIIIVLHLATSNLNI